jgi:hypothetical protein
LKHAFGQARELKVKRAAAQIIDRDFGFLLELVQAISQRGGGGFVDDALDAEPGQFAALFVALRCASLKYAGTVMTARVTGSPSAASAFALQLLQHLGR